MGKSKRTHYRVKGNGQDVAYVRPAPQADNVHPVDMSNVTAVCTSCQSDNTVPSLDDLMSDGGHFVIFRYWLPTSDCLKCQQKDAYQVYNFKASGITTAKLFEIVAACELKCGRKIVEMGDHLDRQSVELLKPIYLQIKKTYKDAHVAKRPKDAILQINDILYQLDYDVRLRGQEKITFICENGLMSFSLSTVTLKYQKQ